MDVEENKESHKEGGYEIVYADNPIKRLNDPIKGTNSKTGKNGKDGSRTGGYFNTFDNPIKRRNDPIEDTNSKTRKNGKGTNSKTGKLGKKGGKDGARTGGYGNTFDDNESADNTTAKVKNSRVGGYTNTFDDNENEDNTTATNETSTFHTTGGYYETFMPIEDENENKDNKENQRGMKRNKGNSQGKSSSGSGSSETPGSYGKFFDGNKETRRAWEQAGKANSDRGKPKHETNTQRPGDYGHHFDDNENEDNTTATNETSTFHTTGGYYETFMPEENNNTKDNEKNKERNDINIEALYPQGKKLTRRAVKQVGKVIKKGNSQSKFGGNTESEQSSGSYDILFDHFKRDKTEKEVGSYYKVNDDK